MIEVRNVSLCRAPLSVAFAYLDDYRNVPQWMFGLASFAPDGEQVQGVGATFHGVFQIKPVKLASTVAVTQWELDKLLRLESVSGFRNRSTWQFSAPDAEHTRIDMTFSYDLPGGVAGRVMGRALEPVVALSIRHSDEALRREIEIQARAG
jgi:uncharacterized membrane protein